MGLWKLFRKIFSIVNKQEMAFGRNEKMFSNKNYANALITQCIDKGAPCLITRFGANELNTIVNYVEIENGAKQKWSYIKGKAPYWKWEKNRMQLMYQNAGVFPMTTKSMERFSKLHLSILSEIDILGSWLKEEQFLQHYMSQAKRIVLEDMEPFFTDRPWTWALKNKKVLVIHPFEHSIRQQYPQKDKIFSNQLLPDFYLITIKAPLSIKGQEDIAYKDWFEALEDIKAKMDHIDYDICIIGCGAYGMPLAAHAKKTGHIAIHLGGVTQLLFGIIGKRWENFYYWPYANLFNPYWIRPSGEEVPKNAQKVEGKCYW